MNSASNDLRQHTNKPRPWQHFDLATLPATPWKNGGGVTRDIVRVPASASLDDFQWRISAAEVACSGAFSAFVGVDRQLMLLQGEGMRLCSEQAGFDVCLHADGKVFAFAGEVDVDGRLLAGAVSDFNVMVRRGQWRANTTVWRQQAELAAQHACVLVWQGVWQGELSGEAHTVSAGQGVWWHDVGLVSRWQPASEDAALILVVLQPQDENSVL